jgi:hypothetical protein
MNRQYGRRLVKAAQVTGQVDNNHGSLFKERLWAVKVRLRMLISTH